MSGNGQNHEVNKSLSFETYLVVSNNGTVLFEIYI